MQRSGTEDVPGCGGTDTEPGEDFCYVPPPGELVIAADDGDEELHDIGIFLGECQGDCDSDDDCEVSLTTF